jgi:hypothetical protein
MRESQRTVFTADIADNADMDCSKQAFIAIIRGIRGVNKLAVSC